MQKKINRIGVFVFAQFFTLFFSSIAFESYVYEANGYIVLSAIALALAISIACAFYAKHLKQKEAEHELLRHNAWVRLNEKSKERNRHFDAMFLESKPFGRHTQTRDEDWRISTAFN